MAAGAMLFSRSHSQTPHAPGLRPRAPLRRSPPRDQALEPSSHAEHQEKRPQPHLRPRCPLLHCPEAAGILGRASQGNDRPRNSAPSSRPPQPLAGGQTKGHSPLCHGLGARCPGQACAPGVAKPTKIQGTPGFQPQPRLPRPVLSLRRPAATRGGAAAGRDPAAPAPWQLGNLGCCAPAAADGESGHQLRGWRCHPAPSHGQGTGSNPHIGSAFSTWAGEPGLGLLNRSHWRFVKKPGPYP